MRSEHNIYKSYCMRFEFSKRQRKRDRKKSFTDSYFYELKKKNMALTIAHLLHFLLIT